MLTTVATTLASIVAILAGVIGFTRWWRYRDKLTVEVGFHAFMLPPTIPKAFSDIRTSVSTKGDALLANLPEYLNRETATSVIRDLTYSVPYSLDWKILSLRGLWLARVQNNGRKKLQGVNLYLPNGVFVKIERDGDTSPQEREISGVIHLGDLRSKSGGNVIAWTNAVSGNYDLSQITLAHDNGIGKVLPIRTITERDYSYNRIMKVIVWLFLLTFVALLLIENLTPRPNSRVGIRSDSAPTPIPNGMRDVSRPKK